MCARVFRIPCYSGASAVPVYSPPLSQEEAAFQMLLQRSDIRHQSSWGIPASHSHFLELFKKCVAVGLSFVISPSVCVSHKRIVGRSVAVVVGAGLCHSTRRVCQLPGLHEHEISKRYIVSQVLKATHSQCMRMVGGGALVALRSFVSLVVSLV